MGGQRDSSTGLIPRIRKAEHNHRGAVLEDR
jgi:hypothetical protein